MLSTMNGRGRVFSVPIDSSETTLGQFETALTGLGATRPDSETALYFVRQEGQGPRLRALPEQSYNKTLTELGVDPSSGRSVEGCLRGGARALPC